MPKQRSLARTARAAETREAILRTAARMFLRSGIEETSLDAVAAELGLTKGAVYANFPSKGALVAAVAAANSSPQAVFAALLEPGVSLPKRLQAFADRVTSTRASRRVVLLDLEYMIYAARNEGWDQAGRQGFDEEVASLAARFREVNQANGERLPISEESFLRLLNIVGRGVIQEMALHPKSLSADDVARMFELLIPSGRPLSR